MLTLPALYLASMCYLYLATLCLSVTPPCDGFMCFTMGMYRFQGGSPGSGHLSAMYYLTRAISANGDPHQFFGCYLHVSLARGTVQINHGNLKRGAEPISRRPPTSTSALIQASYAKGLWDPSGATAEGPKKICLQSLPPSQPFTPARFVIACTIILLTPVSTSVCTTSLGRY